MANSNLIALTSLSPSNLASIPLPCVLPSPPTLQGFLNTATTGGTLAAGTYGYRISARVGSTETAAGATISVTTTGSTSVVTLSWLPVAGATDYRIYGRTAGSELLLATVAAPATTWADTGSATPSGALPSNGFVEATASPGLWTPPTGKTAQVSGIVVSNPTSYAGQVFLSYVAASGGSSSNRIVGGSIARPDAFAGVPDIDLKRSHVFGPGDYLTGYATVPGLVLTLDGLLSA